MRLTLVRHGQTASNVAGLLDTAPPGDGLTPLGRQQAEALAEVWEGRRLDAVFASHQIRAQQTAEPLAKRRGLSVSIVDGLEEIGAGDLEKSADLGALKRYVETLWAWLGGDLDRTMPGGPSGRSVLARFDRAVERIAHSVDDAGTAVAVSHNAAIGVWTALRVRGMDVLPDGTGQLANTGAAELRRRGKRWELTSWHELPVGQPTGGLPLGRGEARTP